MKNLENTIKRHLPNGIVLMGFYHDPLKDVIKLTIDSAKDVSINETSKIAKNIKNDEYFTSIFPAGFRLEVGTPGIGAELVHKFQYKKNVGRKILLKYKVNYDNFITQIFVLKSVKEKGIKVINSKKNYFIDFDDIISAKIKVSFD